MKVNSSVIKYFLPLNIFLLSCSSAKAQTLSPDSLLIKVEQLSNYLLYKNHDTTYIKSYSEDLIIKIIAVNKITYFKVKDNIKNSSIRFRPDRKLNLGLGIAYKWFAANMTFNAGISEKSNFKNSKYIDLQGNMFSSKQYISASLKYYHGYQMSKLSVVPTPDYPSSPIRDDIRTIYLGIQYTFAFNYDKFSLKAPFIHNEMQRKSAGSFMIGAGFNLFIMDADSSVVPIEVQENFDEILHLRDINSISISANFGYMYTFVWKEHYYLTLSLLPGLGFSMGDYQTEFRDPFQSHLFLGVRTLNSVGYNARRVFGGLQLLGDTYNIRLDKKLKTEVGHGKATLFIGYRFGQS